MFHEPELENAESIQKDLYLLATLLPNELLPDVKPLHDCFVQKRNDGWEYSLKKLEFKLLELPGGAIKPNDIHGCVSVSILFSIKIAGCFAYADDIGDPIVG